MREILRIGMASGVTFAIGLVASLDEAHAVLCELAEGIDDGIYGIHGQRRRRRERNTGTLDSDTKV